MQALAKAAEWFIGLFIQGGNTFSGLVVGIVPLLIVLMTFVNALISLIGAEKIEGVGKAAAREGLLYYPVRYVVLPFLSVFPDQPNGIYHGSLPARKVQTGFL